MDIRIRYKFKNIESSAEVIREFTIEEVENTRFAVWIENYIVMSREIIIPIESYKRK